MQPHLQRLQGPVAGELTPPAIGEHEPLRGSENLAVPGWPYQPQMPEAICRFPGSQRRVFLTFDDGPVPGVTEAVLDLLKQHRAFATFFCVGTRVESHPGLFERIRVEGHCVGNHSHTHPNGWTTPFRPYLADVVAADALIRSPFFRPPYGNLTLPQYLALKQRWTIVNWDVSAQDYDSRLEAVGCFERVTASVQPGSIILFHDTVTAAPRMLEALDRSVDWLRGQGYSFSSIESAAVVRPSASINSGDCPDPSAPGVS